MITVVTKYLGPTNTRPGRISARFAVGRSRAVVEWEHGFNSVDNHTRAVAALLSREGMAIDEMEVFIGDAAGGYTFLVGGK